MSDLMIVIVVFIIWVGGVVLFSFVAEWRHPPTGRFIEIDNVRLHYIEQGPPDGDTVVLLHGNGAMIQDLAISGIIGLLSTSYRVICFDRPGFGYSSRPRFAIWTPDAEAELFAGAFKTLSIQNPIIVGHSWGTLVALALGLRLQEEVKGLVLISGYYFPTMRRDVWFMSGPAVPVFGDILRYTLAPIIGWLISGKVIEKIFAPEPVPVKFISDFPISLALRPKQLRAAAEEAALMIPSAAQLQMRYESLHCPIVIICGAGDEVVRPEQAARLKDLLPRATLHALPASGHMLHHSHQQTVVDAVRHASTGPG
ncbi:MAG TPA: alpha/beta hydrolase [Xanthobacteraceae bacterium]|jgi:pimeloyl-ACP methyl ester carboxylesterase|nr:alpha/beta hydrolase [Xanthobacteraceae bacterium]